MRYRIGYGLRLVFLGLLLLPSCTRDEGLFPDEDGLCEVTIRLNIATFDQTGKAGTRSYVAGNSDENRINDIWVFQYNAETGASLKTPVYLDNFDSNDIRVDLTLNEEGSQSLVCIVANTENSKWALDENDNIKGDFDTYNKLRQQTLPEAVSGAFLSSNMGPDGGKTIPMFGESKAMAIVSKSYVSVPLVRMFARVEVSVDLSYSHEVGMSLDNIVFRDIPFYCRVGSLAPAGGDAQAATYPDAIEWKDYSESGANDLVLYFPENLQGKVQDMSSKQEATEGFPDKALKVDLVMSYEKDGMPRTHTYTVYPGLDMVNDFNIKRNHIYNVSVKITKLPE